LKVKRIVSNIEANNLESAKVFYEEILGLELVMDLGWIQTYSTDSQMSVHEFIFLWNYGLLCFAFLLFYSFYAKIFVNASGITLRGKFGPFPVK
jgi:hypothetical protein